MGGECVSVLFVIETRSFGLLRRNKFQGLHHEHYSNAAPETLLPTAGTFQSDCRSLFRLVSANTIHATILDFQHQTTTFNHAVPRIPPTTTGRPSIRPSATHRPTSLTRSVASNSPTSVAAMADFWSSWANCFPTAMQSAWRFASKCPTT